MKKSSILLSITTAALSLPALADKPAQVPKHPSTPKSNKVACDNEVLKKVKKDLDQCQEALVFKEVNSPSTSKKSTATETEDSDLSLEIDSGDENFSLTLVEEGSGDSTELSLSIEDEAETSDATSTTGSGEGTGNNDTEFDKASVFGTQSKIALRKLKPVKQLLIDFMYGYTKVEQNNGQYNFYPNRTAPFIKANTFAATLDIPVSDKIDINVLVENDSVTSASPIFYAVSGASPSDTPSPAPQASDEIKQGVTGASIYDQRAAGSVSFNYYGEKITATVQGGTSKERDYTSHNISGNAGINLAETNTTLSFGANFIRNDIRANQLGANFATRENGTNQGLELLGGFTQIINSTLISQFAVTYYHNQGYMNDVYKPDLFPGFRNGWSYAGKVLKYLPDFHESSLDFDYRYYTDDWGIRSHTIKSSLRVAFAHGWAFEPGVRYYSQDRSKFYNLFIPANRNSYYTSDYRYASYGQLVGSIEVNKELTAKVNVYSGFRYGVADASLHLGGKDLTWHTEDRFTAYRLWGVYFGIKSLY